MTNGYYYDMGKRIGYDITVGNQHFGNVAYASKGQLIAQLVRSGYKKEDIEERRIDWEKW